MCLGGDVDVRFGEIGRPEFALGRRRPFAGARGGRWKCRARSARGKKGTQGERATSRLHASLAPCRGFADHIVRVRPADRYLTSVHCIFNDSCPWRMTAGLTRSVAHCARRFLSRSTKKAMTADIGALRNCQRWARRTLPRASPGLRDCAPRRRRAGGDRTNPELRGLVVGEPCRFRIRLGSQLRAPR